VFTPAIVWSSSSDGIAAVDRAIEGDRERGKEIATAIKTATARTEIVRRIMEGLPFQAMNVSREPLEGSKSTAVPR
jgi:hypothetical protein